MDFLKSSLDSGFKNVGLGIAMGLADGLDRFPGVVDNGLAEPRRSVLVGVLRSVSMGPSSALFRRPGKDVVAFLLGVN